jgi:type VI secretion system protein ImpJ
MYTENRVVWAEGMFLRVQHFQQSDRWTERLVRSTTRDMRPFPWGFVSIAINRELLAVGKLALTSARGVFPDGTPFDAPGDADLPPAIEPVEGTRSAIVYLTLPERRGGAAEMGRGGHEDAATRWQRVEYEASDANSDSFTNAPIEIGRQRLGCALSSGPLAGFDRMGVARIVEVRSDRSIVLDDKFIAPTLNCAAEAPLLALITELHGLVGHRAEALAARIADPTVRGTAEIADFLLLQALNRVDPRLRHAAALAAQLHPETFYELCLELAGELATFTAQSKRATVFPDYRHEDLEATFASVFADLRASLSSVLEQTAVAIPLQDRRHGVKVGTINDRSLLLAASFVLAVRANMPAEMLRRSLPNQIKIGPVEQIAQLVNVALPGIRVRPLPVAPRQLPFQSGTVYFELENSGPLWKQLDVSGALALHLAGDFPELAMELWAIR